MSLFNFRWLYKLVRRNTKPIPEQRAALWKQRLSIIYMLAAWQAFGMLVYFSFNKKKDWGEYYGLKSEEEINKRPAIYYAELFGLKNARVVDIKHFKKVSDYEYHTEENEEDAQEEAKTVED